MDGSEVTGDESFRRRSLLTEIRRNCTESTAWLSPEVAIENRSKPAEDLNLTLTQTTNPARNVSTSRCFDKTNY